jgi:hypothetical protein
MLVSDPKAMKNLGFDRRLQFTHGTRGKNTQLFIPAEEFFGSRDTVIWLKRDIPDLMLSYIMKNAPGGKVDYSLRMTKKVLQTVLDFYASAERYGPNLTITYEQLHRVPERTLSNVIQMNWPHDIDQSCLKKAIKYCEFDNILKEQSKFPSRKQREQFVKDGTGRKLRSGIPGQAKKELPTEVYEFIIDYIKENT